MRGDKTLAASKTTEAELEGPHKTRHNPWPFPQRFAKEAANQSTERREWRMKQDAATTAR